MEGKKTLIPFMVIVLLIGLLLGGIPGALAGFQPGTGETTKINLMDAADPTASPVTYPDGQQYIELNDTYTVGETFTVWANVTSVTKLNLYAVGVTYNDSILSCTGYGEGEFFYRADAQYRTNPVNQPILAAGATPPFLGKWNHVAWALARPGHVNGTGTLAVFNFTVVDYGVTLIDIILSGGQVAILGDVDLTDLDYNTIDIIFDNMGLIPVAYGPTADFTIAPPSPWYVDETLTFTGKNTSSEWGFTGYPDLEYCPISNYTWDFGDGDSDSGIVVTHEYDTEGTYTVNLTVTDTQEQDAWATKDVTIHAQVHELNVSVEAPETLEVGESSLLNATVYNLGSGSETNVELQLLINGTVKESETITELLAGSSYTINYSWTPTVEATYNITAYAKPVEGESDTDNNVTYVQAQVIPEFPAVMFLLLFMMATLVVVILVKSTKRRKNHWQVKPGFQ